MSYQEIIQANKETILNLYLAENYKKSAIAYKLINDLDLDFTNAQVDSFRRAINQFLQDWDQATMKHLDETTGQIVSEPRDKYPDAIRTRAKVLLLDVETTPIFAVVWGLFKQTIDIKNIITDSHLLSWAGKWLLDGEVFGDILTPEEAVKNDDKRICQSLWKVMDEADIIIAHNGRRFDVPVINGCFFKNKLHLPSPFEIIDTLESAKKVFRLTSHKLDFINRILELERKLDTKIELWINCTKGVQAALDEMHIYNKKDVTIMEDTYMEMRPYIRLHPNMAFYIDSDELICPTCGCDELKKLEGKPYRTGVNEYASYRCPKCGSYGHSRRSITDPDKRQSLIVSNNR